MTTFKKTDIARAVQVYNALHNGSLTEDQGHAFIGCLEMVLKQPTPEVPQVFSLEGEGMLEAVVRVHAMQRPTDLVFDDIVIHIDPAMTMTEAYQHACYVVGLNHEFPAGGTPEPIGRGIRLRAYQEKAMDEEMSKPKTITLDHSQMSKTMITLPDIESLPEVDDEQAARDAAFEEIEKRKRNGNPIPEVAPEPEKKPLPEYVPLTSGYIHTPERNETIEDTIRRLSPLAPVRVRLCGLVMTVREDIATDEMIEEAHRIIKSGKSDTPMGEEKTLELDEEQLPDGTLRTSRRCWRHGYRYRLDVLPHDRTEMAEYHIHLKDRPTATWMEPHLQLMYDRKAKVFLNITNGIDRYESIVYLYCTAAGRAGRDLELAKLEKQMADEYAERNKPHYQQQDKPFVAHHTPKHESFPVSPAPAKKVPMGITTDWEDPDCAYRVRFFHTTAKAWRYSYFESKPTAQGLRLRDAKEGKATIETKPAK